MHHWRHGSGPSQVLALHETGATCEIWRRLADSLAERAELIAFDRPGWGWTPAPEGYAKTTVGEQGNVALGIADELGLGAATVLCGAGVGAVIALDLTLRHPDRFSGAVLIEPPLLAFVPEATETLSADVNAIGELVAADGRAAVLDSYLDGAFGGLGGGAERIPATARASGAEAVTALFAEFGAVPAWELPEALMATVPRATMVITGADTPDLLVSAASGLATVLVRSELRRTGPGLPHHDQAAEVADLITELVESA